MRTTKTWAKKSAGDLVRAAVASGMVLAWTAAAMQACSTESTSAPEPLGEGESLLVFPPGYAGGTTNGSMATGLFHACGLPSPDDAAVRIGPLTGACGVTDIFMNGTEPVYLITLDPTQCGNRNACCTLHHESEHLPFARATVAECKKSYSTPTDLQKCIACTTNSARCLVEAVVNDKDLGWCAQHDPSGSASGSSATDQWVCLHKQAQCACVAQNLATFPTLGGRRPTPGCGAFDKSAALSLPTHAQVCECDTLCSTGSSCAGSCSGNAVCGTCPSCGNACVCKPPAGGADAGAGGTGGSTGSSSGSTGSTTTTTTTTPTGTCTGVTCPTCGNGTCDAAESCESCPQDCGSCVVCGDHVCDSARGETCANCPADCCPPPPDAGCPTDGGGTGGAGSTGTATACP